MKERHLDFSPFVVSCERCKKPANGAGGRYRCQKCGRLVCDPCSALYAPEPARPGIIVVETITSHQLLCVECGVESVLADGLVKVTSE